MWAEEDYVLTEPCTGKWFNTSSMGKENKGPQVVALANFKHQCNINWPAKGMEVESLNLSQPQHIPGFLEQQRGEKPRECSVWQEAREEKVLGHCKTKMPPRSHRKTVKCILAFVAQNDINLSEQLLWNTTA